MFYPTTSNSTDTEVDDDLDALFSTDRQLAQSVKTRRFRSEGIIRPWRHRKEPHMTERGSRDGYGRSQRDLIFWQLLAKLTDHSVGQSEPAG